MTITQATKNQLIAFAQAQGFEVHNSDAVENKGYWLLTCNQGETFGIRVDALKQHLSKGSNIVCPQCKATKKLNKFTAASNVRLDVTENDDWLVTCNDCALSYIYTGQFYRPFNCFCKLKMRTQEHAFYKALHEVYPGCLAREVPYIGNHKADIALYLEDLTVFIEVDDVTHRFSPRKEQDAAFEEKFEEECKDHEFLMRIDDRDIRDNLEEALEDFLDYLDTL